MQGSSNKRKRDSSSRKLVQRSLVDYLVRPDQGRSPRSANPPATLPSPEDVNKENREAATSGEPSFKVVVTENKECGNGALLEGSTPSSSKGPCLEAHVPGPGADSGAGSVLAQGDCCARDPVLPGQAMAVPSLAAQGFKEAPLAEVDTNKWQK